MLAAAKIGVANVLQHVASRWTAPYATFPPSRMQALLGSQSAQYFIGYYDVQPFAPDERSLLIHRVAGDGPAAEIGVINLQTNEFHKLETTLCWCWQLGARLQFYDAEHAIFNTIDEGVASADIVDLTGKTVSRLPWNIFALDERRQRAAVVDFGLLHSHRPGYGYQVLADQAGQHSREGNRGILVVQIASRSIEAIVDVNHAWWAAVDHKIIDESTRGAPCYLNHPVFSPDGEKLVFVLVVESGRGRKLAMMIAEAKSGKIVSVLPHRSATHNWWADNSNIVAFLHHGERRRGYYAVWNPEFGTLEALGVGWPDLDGHPSRARPGFWVTDTYPDLLGFQTLVLLDGPESKARVNVSKIRAPLGMKWDKCDLHPRVSPSGRKVAVDTAFDGRRHVAVFDISAAIGQSK